MQTVSDPAVGDVSTPPPDSLARFKGPTSKGMGAWEGKGNGEVRGVATGGKRKEGEGRGEKDGLQHWTPSGRPNSATPLN